MLLLLLSRFSYVWLCATPETTAHQAPPSLGFSRQEHWSGLPFPSPVNEKMNPGLRLFLSRSFKSYFYSSYPTIFLKLVLFLHRTLNFTVCFLVFRHPSLWHCKDPLKLCSLKSFSWVKFLIIYQQAQACWHQYTCTSSHSLGCYGSGKDTFFLVYIHNIIRSDQISHSVVPDSLRPHESQHARPPCPSPTPRVHPDSRPSSQWCHPCISSLSSPSPLAPNSSQHQSFPMSQLFAWGGQSTGVSALASFLPKKSQGWSPSEWTGWVSLQFKGLSRVFSNTTVQKYQFFGAQPSSQSNSHIHTWPQEKPQPWLDGPLLAK